MLLLRLPITCHDATPLYMRKRARWRYADALRYGVADAYVAIFYQMERYYASALRFTLPR